MYSILFFNLRKLFFTCILNQIIPIPAQPRLMFLNCWIDDGTWGPAVSNGQFLCCDWFVQCGINCYMVLNSRKEYEYVWSFFLDNIFFKIYLASRFFPWSCVGQQLLNHYNFVVPSLLTMFFLLFVCTQCH